MCKENRKNKKINVMLTEDVFDALKIQADKDSISVSAFVRRLIIERLVEIIE